MRHSELESINFRKGGGLVPVVVQDRLSGQVYMLGYMNPKALECTLETRYLHLWSRSRQELWLKGKESGNVLRVSRLAVDCDGDALLAEVEPATGETAICHTGAETCFFTSLLARQAEDSSFGPVRAPNGPAVQQQTPACLQAGIDE